MFYDFVKRWIAYVFYVKNLAKAKAVSAKFYA